jgi:hypothetical protein
MPNIFVHFQNHNPLIVDLEDSETAGLYLEVLRRNLEKEAPIWRDLLKYDLEYFKELCWQVQKTLGWNWDMANFTTSDTVRFHKDIENSLLKENSFDNIPGEHQQLIHEVHHCLHNMEVKDAKYPRGDFLQFEWFNGDYEEMPSDKKFKIGPELGDIILQNPYVGHPPLQCYMFNDYQQIERTCAFQDRIKPALKIGLSNDTHFQFDEDDYKTWWIKKCPGFVDKHGMDTVLRYTGWPVIGKVRDIDYLNQLVKIKELNFESLEIV